jgi:hypothetical protein
MQYILNNVNKKIKPNNNKEKDNFNSYLNAHSTLMKEYSKDILRGNSSNKVSYETQLQSLNSKLIDSANEIFEEIGKKQNRQDFVDDNIREKRILLKQKIDVLEKERKLINNLINKKDTLERDFDSTQSLVVSNKIQYRLWLFGVVIVLLFTFRHLIK